MQHLRNLDPAEVSLVNKGANLRRFLVIKSQDGDGAVDIKELREKIAKHDPELSKRVDKVLKSFRVKKDGEDGGAEIGERAQTALKAVVRILAPFKEELDPLALHEVLDAAGFEMLDKAAGGKMSEKTEKDFMALPAKPEGVSKEAYEAACKAAKKAYDDEVAKLGTRQAPDAQPELTNKAADADKKEKEVEKSAVEKALGDVPKELRGFAELIFKANAELVQKNEGLIKQVAELQEAQRTRDYVAKAQGFDKLGVKTDELASTLQNIAKADLALAEKVEKMLGAVNEQVKKGAEFGSAGLYGEIGTSVPRFTATGGDEWAKIEAAAMAVVQKSGEKITKAEAVDAYLQTPEGKKQYAVYKAEQERAARQQGA